MSAPPCPLCGGRFTAWFAKSTRHFVRCATCALVHVPEGLATNAAGVSIYEAEDDVFAADGNEGYYLDHESNLANCRLKVDWVARDLPPGSHLLDVGANFGHFLKVAGERYDARGFDVSPRAVAWSRAQFGVRNEVLSVEALPASPGDVDGVTCWDVVEHVSDPQLALRRLRGALNPGGLLFVSTPDAGSLAARLLGRHWHYLDPVQHLNLFTRENLTGALARAGFKVRRVGALGHRYRLGYVFDRLRYLHSRGPLGAATALLGVLGRPLRERSLHLQLGDVMILTAEAQA